MILDARELPAGQRLEADLCIVGAGAAGLTLALEMIGTGLKVLVLEGGDYGYDERSQALYAGENVGFRSAPLDEARLRMFGGSTNHWAGNCMVYDPIDFEARPEVPHSGWPITRADLDPYYLRAAPLVELRQAEDLFDPKALARQAGGPLLDLGAGRLRNMVMNESPPTAFGYRYEAELQAAENVTVMLNASLLEIVTSADGGTVTELSMAVIDGPRFTATAREYVLAAGGIETARILLLSNRVRPAGIGNENDLVGRFFMDHAALRPALVVLQNDPGLDLSVYTESIDGDGGTARVALAASDEMLRREGIGNFRVHLHRAPDAAPGADSARSLVGGLKRGKMPDRLGYHLHNVLTDLDGISGALLNKATGGRDDAFGRPWLEAWIGFENFPHPDSRITLTDATDMFGQRRIRFDWKVDEADRRTARRATELLAGEIGRLGLGRTWSDILWLEEDWPERMNHGKHHIGTARMSDDPKTGVVDRHCRVHSVGNLHIAGSAVFPTSGQCTPTFTIVAMSVRLADRLKSIFGV